VKSLNSKPLIIVVIVFLLGGGYFLFSSNDTKESRSGLTVNIQKPTTSVGQDSDYPVNYIDYSAEAFQKARNDGKVVMLYFTANWCPTCNAQEPVNVEAFKQIENESDIVVFKIHILDSETTDETEELADEFGVRLQHSYVLINPQGEVVFTHTGPLVKDDLVKNLLNAKG